MKHNFKYITDALQMDPRSFDTALAAINTPDFISKLSDEIGDNNQHYDLISEIFGLIRSIYIDKLNNEPLDQDKVSRLHEIYLENPELIKQIDQIAIQELINTFRINPTYRGLAFTYVMIMLVLAYFNLSDLLYKVFVTNKTIDESSEDDINPVLLGLLEAGYIFCAILMVIIYRSCTQRESFNPPPLLTHAIITDNSELVTSLTPQNFANFFAKEETAFAALIWAVSQDEKNLENNKALQEFVGAINDVLDANPQLKEALESMRTKLPSSWDYDSSKGLHFAFGASRSQPEEDAEQQLLPTSLRPFRRTG